MADHGYAVGLRSVVLTLGIAAACWLVAIAQMRGMDMGVATALGSFGFFIGLWVTMMAAMMLPGAVPAVTRFARAQRRSTAAAAFVVAYLAVWTLPGVVAYSVYRPHSALAAGVATMLAGGYELTPLKRLARRRCRERVNSGFQFGFYCIGSSIGLMLLLLALGVMSIGWMATVAVLALAQKLLPPRAAVDIPLAIAFVALGAVIITIPSSIPGLVPSM